MDVVDHVRDGGTTYLTKYGKRVAAVVPPDVAEWFEQVEDEYWMRRAQEVRDRGEPTVSWEQAVAELESDEQ